MAIHVASPGTAPAQSRQKLRDQRAWLTFVLAEIAFLVTYFSLPGNSLFLWPPVGLAAVIGTVIGIRRYRPAKPAAWYLLAASELCFVAGDTTYRVLTRVLHQVNPFPSLADGFYLLTYPLFAAGLFLLLKTTVGLRLHEDAEYDGADLAEHDLNAYPDFQQTMIKSYHLREA